jgi:hypothetical protein
VRICWGLCELEEGWGLLVVGCRLLVGKRVARWAGFAARAGTSMVFEVAQNPTFAELRTIACLQA